MTILTDTTENSNLRPSINGHFSTSFDSDLEGNVFDPDQIQAEQHAQKAQSMLLEEGISDEGNAQCTRELYRGKFAYSESLGFMHRPGPYWTQENAEAAVDRAIVETIISRATAALQSGKAEKYEKLIKNSIPNRSRVHGAKALLQSLIVTSPSEFDAEPDLLNCPNGFVHLRTGELHPHSPAHRFTHCTTVNYDPNADYSVWVDWLRTTLGNDAVVEWVQMAAGYTATGHTLEEILFYLLGPSRSGKGTFTEALLALFGSPLAKEVNFSTFTAQRAGDSQNFDLAPLKPCRAVFASESNSYERFNEAKVKALTGGNEIYCAFKHRTHFSYRPQFKIWLSSNQPVNADPDDDAVWGRIRVIEFPNSYLGNEDKHLKQRMKDPAVLEGILAWVVEGAVKWYKLGKTGLPELESSTKAKDKIRGELDNVQAWLDEECTVDDDAFTIHKDIYRSYRWWCENNGVTAKAQKGLTQALEKKGFIAARQRHGTEKKVKRGIKGIRVDS